MDDFYVTRRPSEMSAAALECGASEELVQRPEPASGYEDYTICTRRLEAYEGRAERYVCTVRGPDGLFGLGYGQTIGQATDAALRDGGRAESR